MMSPPCSVAPLWSWSRKTSVAVMAPSSGSTTLRVYSPWGVRNRTAQLYLWLAGRPAPGITKKRGRLAKIERR
ncbi:MAG: hypothetical protein QOF58_5343 [Pseudonocardiales bacterium]|nr:hypothetical protein [Pseudonocardiales bacterium]